MQEFTNLQKFTQCSVITSNYCGIMQGAFEKYNFDRIGLTSFTNLSLAVLSLVLKRLRLYLWKQRDSGESCCLQLHKSCLRSFSITIHFSFKKGQKNRGVEAGQGSVRQWQCDGLGPPVAFPSAIIKVTTQTWTNPTCCADRQTSRTMTRH